MNSPDKVKKDKKDQSSKNDKEFADFFKKHNQDIKKQNMSKIERAPLNRRRNVILFVFSLLILVLAATLLGFYFFTKENKFTEEGVKVTIDVPTLVSSGDEISISLLIQNQETVDLKLSQLAMRWPDGFKFISAQPSPSNEFNNAWDLATIKSGQEERIIIRGQIVGEVDTEKSFLATYSYVPSNFNSEFKKEVIEKITISSSTIDLVIEAPDAVLNEQDVQFRISYTNKSTENLAKVRLRLDYPDGFKFNSAEPSPRSGNNNIWQQDSLAENEKIEITVLGHITGQVGSTIELRAEIGLMKADGTFSLQSESFALMTILEPISDLQLTVNNNYEDSIVEWGDDLEYQIKFSNSGEVILNDLELTLTWEQEPADFLQLSSIIDDNNGSATEEGITWGSSQIPALQSFRPGDELEIDVQISLDDYGKIEDESLDSFFLTSQVVATSSSLSDTESAYSQDSNIITNKLATTVIFQSEGRYYDDDFAKVGTGPLPPQVGEETTYQIQWTVHNTSNPLSNLAITTNLPDGATWLGHKTVTPGGTLAYNKKQNTITWTIDELPAHLGQLSSVAQAHFSITITPSQSDLGKAIGIIERSILGATDTHTEEKIELSTKAISTDLKNDEAAQSKSLVIQGEAVTNSNTNQNVNTNINANLNSNLNSNS